jgi:hypothetical protein
MALSFIFSVDVSGLSGEEVPHGSAEVPLLGTDQQMEHGWALRENGKGAQVGEG